MDALYDDSEFMIGLVRSSTSRFVQFEFMEDVFDEVKDIPAGPYTVGQLLQNPGSQKEIQKVSRGNLAEIDDNAGKIAVRMLTEDNKRIYVVDFKKMRIYFNGNHISDVLGVDVDPKSNKDITIQTTMPLLTPSVLQAYGK